MTPPPLPPLPVYLQGREERGEDLPQAKVVEAATGKRKRREDAVSVRSVLQYVFCDLKSELFVELMEVMG